MEAAATGVVGKGSCSVMIGEIVPYPNGINCSTMFVSVHPESGWVDMKKQYHQPTLTHNLERKRRSS